MLWSPDQRAWRPRPRRQVALLDQELARKSEALSDLEGLRAPLAELRARLALSEAEAADAAAARKQVAARPRGGGQGPGAWGHGAAQGHGVASPWVGLVGQGAL